VSVDHVVYGQHREWATLGFIRAIASNATVRQCLVDKRWLYTLLSMISVPAATPALSDHDHDDDDDDDGQDVATPVHHLTLPQRVIICHCFIS